MSELAEKMVREAAMTAAQAFYGRKVDPAFITTPATGGKVFTDISQKVLAQALRTLRDSTEQHGLYAFEDLDTLATQIEQESRDDQG